MAGYFTDQILDRIRQTIGIVDLVRGSVSLKKAGTGYKGLCPFHREKTPSFNVNPEKQIFKCFGCGQGGDIFTFVMKTEKVSFQEAVSILAERAHIELPTSRGGPSRGEKSRLQQLNAWAAEMFHRWLVKDAAGKQTLKYLAERDITPETIERFQLGYSPAGWRSLLDAGGGKGFSSELMAKAGLLSSSERSEGFYDRFRNRLMFPIRDAQERVIGFGARSLDGKEPKYLNSPETTLFAKGRVLYGLDKAAKTIREKRRVVVVEGYMDVMMAHQCGIAWSVGVLGTALTRDHVRLLKRYADEVVLVFDADNAGQSSASRSLDAFAVEELPARVVTLPDQLDPDDFLRRNGKEAFIERASEAVDGVTYKLNRALVAMSAAGSSVAVARVLDDVLAMVAMMPSPVARSVEIKKITERTRIPEPALQERVGRLAARPRSFAERQSGQTQQAPVRNIERELLEVALTYPETQASVCSELAPDLLRDGNVRTLMERLIRMSSDAGQVGPVELLARTQEDSLRPIVEEIVGRERQTVEEPQQWCRELLDGLRARADLEVAAEWHGKLMSGEVRSADEQNRALTELLNAKREAQRRKGKLEIKRN